MKKFKESKENKNTTILFVQNEKLRKEMKKKVQQFSTLLL